MKNISILAVFAVSLCLTTLVPIEARAFDLFNQDRGKAPPPPPPPPRPPTPKKPVKPKQPPKPKPQPPQKDFGLQGTSQLGQHFRAVLLTPKNQVLKINWRKGGKSVDLGDGFRLLKVEPRKVLVAYPPSSLCREDRRNKGVDCSTDGKTATLSMVLGKPTPMKSVARAQPVSTTSQASAPKTPTLTNEQRQRNNAIERAAGAGGSIKPENVPPGMRVVKTPFGDRLVPIKK